MEKTLNHRETYKIVADEPQFLLVSKVHEVSIHNEPNSNECGLIQRLRRDLGREDLLPVHRLDKATSGLLLVGKGSDNTRELSMLFQQKKITKLYWAVASGKPRKKQGKIIGDIEKSRGGSYKLSQARQNPSVTQFLSFSLAPGLRAYLLLPLTGKTHQLRVVMKSLGTPILGDARYGKSTHDMSITGQESTRLCLHASALRFSAFNKQYQFEEIPTFNLSDDLVFDSLIQEMGSVFNAPFSAFKRNKSV